MKAYLSAASLAAAAIALLCGCAPAHSTDQRPRGEPVAWVQYGPLGPEVRAAADAAGCPTAMVDDKPIALTVRVGADENFPTLCRADLVGAGRVRLGPVDVTLPGAAPEVVESLRGRNFYALLFEKLRSSVSVSDAQLQALGAARTTETIQYLSAAGVAGSRVSQTAAVHGEAGSNGVAQVLGLTAAGH